MVGTGKGRHRSGSRSLWFPPWPLLSMRSHDAGRESSGATGERGSMRHGRMDHGRARTRALVRAWPGARRGRVGASGGKILGEPAGADLLTSKKKWITAKTTSWGTSCAQLRMHWPSSAVPARGHTTRASSRGHQTLLVDALAKRFCGVEAGGGDTGGGRAVEESAPRESRSHSSSSIHSAHSAAHHTHSQTREWRSPAGSSQCGLPSWYIRTASAKRRSSRSSGGWPFAIPVGAPPSSCLSAATSGGTKWPGSHTNLVQPSPGLGVLGAAQRQIHRLSRPGVCEGTLAGYCQVELQGEFTLAAVLSSST